MSNIREMDDFFDLGPAMQHSNTMAVSGRPNFGGENSHNHAASAYDIDLILAEAANDDAALMALQNLNYNIDPLLQSPEFNMGISDTSMCSVNNFNDYAQWANSTAQPGNSCTHCKYHKLQCDVIRDPAMGYSGVCTSCVTLSQQCSFMHHPIMDNSHFMAPNGNYQPCTDINMSNSPITQGYAQSPVSNSPSFRESSHEYSEGTSRTGARFSRETIKVLRNWLQIHHVHPYPTEEEKDDLKRKTGLTKVQISNWLANARRRGQVKPPRTEAPSPQNRSRPMKIPRRNSRALDNLPLERWRNSPPEDEPASVSAIAKAVESSSAVPSSETTPNSYARSEGSGRSIAQGSSASSRNTTHSSANSNGSVLSHHSQGSFGSFGKRGRRRRRHTTKPIANLIAGPTRQYQCTFCSETFKTKHDWQRHEKSLHLSLERWVCAPNKGKNVNLSTDCAFCGVPNPTSAHSETHNHMTCSDRPLEERTFYRKDHLRQHLRLVHNCQFQASTMDAWKIAAPEVRSRCGFCGITMDTWSQRVDHLAEHFKAGRTMHEWKGGWGFQSSVMKLVENGTPPCRPIPTDRQAYATLTDIRKSYPLPEDSSIICE